MNWKEKPFWTRLAAGFTIVWIGLVIVLTKGDQDHWLNNTMFLLPIAVWVVILIVFRKSGQRDDQ